MKNKIIILMALLAALTGCAAPKAANTVWVGADPVKYLDQRGLQISSIYLMDDGKAMVMQSVVTDSALVVAPYKVADGTYKLSGNLKRNADIEVNTVTMSRDSLKLKGLVNLKKNSMILVYPDNTTKPFLRNTNITFEK